MSHPQRFVDDGKSLSAFAGEVHVRCVRCGAPGTVVAERAQWHWAARFRCAACDLDLCSSRGDWVGPVRLVGRRPCGRCGHKWLAPRIDQAGWPRELQDSTVVACPACGHESSVPLEAHRLQEGAGHNDPHFGMPLLLVDAGRHGALWAYNAAHLRALDAYVLAVLRERSANAGNSSMFSRLPSWMKSAKNREAVSRRLARLARLLPGPATEAAAPGEQRLKVLFICSRNQWRSPTAEKIWRNHPALAVRSAGTSPNARHHVTAQDVRWAEAIFVMEEKHKSRLMAEFGREVEDRPVHVLDIPDEYKYMDPALVEELERSVGAILGLS